MAWAAARSARSDDEAISAVRTVAACAAPTNAHELATMAADDARATSRCPSPLRLIAPAPTPSAVRRTLFNVKPAVGFPLPSAGLSPAPGEKTKMRDVVPVRTFSARRRPALTSPVILRERRPAGAAAGR